MKCPKCPGSYMILETWPGVELERCPTCQGLFLDAGELERMLSAAVASRVDVPVFTPLAKEHDLVTGTCHRCQALMEPVLGPRHTRLDRCPGCGGVFLDQGELSEMRKG
ncbi:MAG: zf-TFIIB domain-containing protein [Polyangia bacterium]|jgi:Zn-finger nucleic acid-binding protein|nr:zf-TFIIB domain-containing protein [Polyangia bacterium]